MRAQIRGAENAIRRDDTGIRLMLYVDLDNKTDVQDNDGYLSTNSFDLFPPRRWQP
jgi:hypothetical protein